jgi:acyl dehydratase
MNKAAIGRRYARVSLAVTADSVRRAMTALRREDDVNGRIPLGILPAPPALVREIFNDLTADGFDEHRRRLFAGAHIELAERLDTDRPYDVDSEIIAVRDVEADSGRLQLGTFELQFSAPGEDRRLASYRWTFAERQAGDDDGRRPSGAAPLAGRPLPEQAHPGFTREEILDYVEAVEDPNPLHRDEDFARSIGFPTVVASGGMALGLLGSYVERAAGKGDVAVFAPRLHAPLFPGEELQLSGSLPSEVDGSGRVAMVCRLAAGPQRRIVATADAKLGVAPSAVFAPG